MVTKIKSYKDLEGLLGKKVSIFVSVPFTRKNYRIEGELAHNSFKRSGTDDANYSVFVKAIEEVKSREDLKGIPVPNQQVRSQFPTAYYIKLENFEEMDVHILN